jgi:hypothetical protein
MLSYPPGPVPSDFAATVNVVYYSITDGGALNLYLPMPLPGTDGTDFWDAHIYQLANILAGLGYQIVSPISKSLVSSAEQNNTFTVAGLVYPQPA